MCEKAAKKGDTIAIEALKGIKEVMDETRGDMYLEYPCHSPDRKRWFGMRAMKFDSDEPMVVIAHMDISERKLAEEERERTTADIILRHKALEQFSYIVSHNLRAPVANILGITAIVQKDDLEPEIKIEFMDALFESIKKLDTVILDLNDILNVKHGVSEKSELVRFSQLAGDIYASINNIIEKEKAVITWDFSGIDEMLTLKSYLHSIFYNLISNSLKYRRPDIPPVIKITSRKTGNKIVLQFKDNGMGIDLEQKGEQVFGLYKRFHTGSAEGKGMGLYMVKTQVETLGGKIRLKSAVNKGATFTIEFENNQL